MHFVRVLACASLEIVLGADVFDVSFASRTIWAPTMPSAC